MAGEQFSLVWNSFPTNLSSGLYSLLTDEHLVDVTLAAEGKILRAHKLILSVCSTYFRDLFKGNTCKHPIVILKDVNYRDLSAMLHFMYQGEVNIKQEDIASFLKVAETLQIKGLTKEKTENKQKIEDEEEPMKTETISDDLDLPINSPEKLDLFSHENSLQQTNLPVDNSNDVIQSSKVTFQNDKNFKLDTGVHSSTIPTLFNENFDNCERLSNAAEPLDFTPDTRQLLKNNEKFLDYRFGEGCSTSEATTSSPDEKNLSTFSTTEDIPSDYQTDTAEVLPGNTDYTNDLPYESSCPSKSPKGRRTVKGIPHSILPLETTLRVVSELGPTLRVERGKVVRMYSCPWCLRHFTRKENLKLHVRYIHGPLESLTCKLCGNKYKNSNSLRVHSYLYHNTKRNKHNKPPLVTSNA